MTRQKRQIKAEDKKGIKPQLTKLATIVPNSQLETDKMIPKFDHILRSSLSNHQIELVFREFEHVHIGKST